MKSYDSKLVFFFPQMLSSRTVSTDYYNRDSNTEYYFT